MAMRGISAFFQNVGDARRHRLLRLEFKNQIHALGDKFLSVADGGIRIEFVVEDHQFHAGSGCSRGNSLCQGNRERQLGALDGKPKVQAAWPRNQPAKPVVGLGHIATVDQCFEDAIVAGFEDIGLLEDVFE